MWRASLRTQGRAECPAPRLGISQSRVSRIEHGDIDHAELATVRAYIAALGGEVEVVAKFGDERMTIA